MDQPDRETAQDRADMMRPNDSPDYQRFIEITQQMDGEQAHGVTDEEQLGSLADLPVLRSRAKIRVDQILGKPARLPTHEQFLHHAANAWAEGFMTGLLFIHHGGHRELGGLPLALDDRSFDVVAAELKTLYMDRNIKAEYEDRVDLYALSYVGALKAQKYWNLLGQRIGTTLKLYAGMMGIWLEGFYYGARFQQLGGHRDA